MAINLMVALPALGHGGCEYSALTVSMLFHRWYLDRVTVLIPEETGTEFIRTTARSIGLRVEGMPVDIRADVEPSAFNGQVAQWAAFLAERRPDVVFVNFPWFLFGTSLPVAAHRTGTPALVKFALVPENIAFLPHVLTPLREAFSGRQVWFTNSATNSALLASALGVDSELIEHMHVAPMGTRYIAKQSRPEQQIGLRHEIGAGAKSAVIICVARLDHQKGVDVLLAAAAPLLRQHDARLVFLGEGPLGEELGNEIRRLDLSGHVHKLGFRTNVAELLAQADVFAMPTRFEGGTSQALLEACAASLPVVVTELPAIRDLLGGVEGASLVPIDDVEATRAALRQLLDTSSGLRRALGRKVKAAAASLNVETLVMSTRKRVARLVPGMSLRRAGTVRRICGRMRGLLSGGKP